MRNLDKSRLLLDVLNWHTTSMLDIKQFLTLSLITIFPLFLRAEPESQAALDIKATLLREIKEGSGTSAAFRELAILEASEQNFGLAKGYILSALQKNPWDFKTWQVYQYLKFESPIRSSFREHSTWQALYTAVGMRIEFWVLTTIVLATVFVTLAILIRQMAQYRRAKTTGASFEFKVMTMISIGVFAIFVSLIWINKLTVEGITRGVVVETSSLKTFKDEGAPEVTQVLPGSDFKVLDKFQKWLFIQLPDDQVGWILESKTYLIPSLMEN